MGRFPPEIERDMRIRFLEFVYEYDTNTGAKYDQPYFEAVLKRCCAISASFLEESEWNWTISGICWILEPIRMTRIMILQ